MDKKLTAFLKRRSNDTPGGAEIHAFVRDMADKFYETSGFQADYVSVSEAPGGYVVNMYSKPETPTMLDGMGVVGVLPLSLYEFIWSKMVVPVKEDVPMVVLSLDNTERLLKLLEDGRAFLNASDQRAALNTIIDLHNKLEIERKKRQEVMGALDNVQAAIHGVIHGD